MTEYDLGKVVGDDGEAGNGIASITKTGTSGLVDTYTITYDDGTTTTFTVTNGSDASVTIQTSWGSTTSDSKVPSEKLTKNSLDNKLDKSQTSYKGKNVVVDSTSGLITFENKPTIPTKVSDLTNDSGFITSSSLPTKTSDLTNDGDGTNAFLTQHQSLTNYIQKSSTSGLLKNDGTVDTTSYSTFSGSYNDLSNKPTIPSASSTTPSADTTSGSYGSGTSYARSNHTHPKSSLYAEATHSHTKSQITDFPSIPSKTSDLTNDGSDGTNVFVANNDSRLSDARTPTSHTHGSLTNDGKLGTTSGKPVITTTGGAITTGSFGSTSGTFAEGNHTHSGYVSATKVTSWQSTPSDSNVPSEKLVKDYVDGLIGSAISYIVGSGS